jgi:hypothetical protein
MLYTAIAMASSVTLLRRAPPEPEHPLERVRELVLDIAPAEGHLTTLDPDLCIYRLAAPTTIHKAATFGVTLAVILQGSKQLRLAAHELVVQPQSLLVITREIAHVSVAVSESPERPFLALSFCFSPERVARALLAVTQAGAAETPETVPAFVLPATNRSPTRSSGCCVRWAIRSIENSWRP